MILLNTAQSKEFGQIIHRYKRKNKVLGLDAPLVFCFICLIMQNQNHSYSK